jgi:hypothetical protein
VFYPRYHGTELSLEKLPRHGPVAFAGPFLVEVEELDQAAASATGLVRLRVRSWRLPPAVVDRMERQLKDLKVIPPELHDSEDLGGVWGWSGPERVDFSQTVSLKNLLRRITTIPSVQGTIGVVLPARVETVRFEDLKAGINHRAGNAKVTLQSIGDREPCTLEFSFTNIDLNDIHIILQDGDGRSLKSLAGFGDGGSNFGNGGETQGSRTITVSKRPARVVASFVAQKEEFNYAFQFDNLRLPDAADMPEQLAPTAFPGHDAPVTVEFVRIEPDEDFPKVWLRVANHANKAVRTLGMNLIYLDNKGNALKDWPASHSGQTDADRGTRTIVEPGATAQFRTTAFFLPKETERVSVIVDKVVFGDATDWRRGSGPNQ